MRSLAALLLVLAAPALAQEARAPRGPRRVKPIPADTVPPERPDLWPRSLACARSPARIHFRPGEEATAREVARLVDEGWAFNIETLGFRAPPSDGGKIGPDERFDVYLWRGLGECWTDVTDGVAATAWDDQLAYLAVDPWGPYGGDSLAYTITHELNHACQAADDWNEPTSIFEMTATWAEQLRGGARLREPLVDFQAHPDWSLDHDPGYDSWFMYGGALFIDFLQARRFGGDPKFMAEVWRRSRSDPDENEPDFLDALDQLLRAKGSSLDDALVEFARWRWGVGREEGAAAGIASRLLAVEGNAEVPTTKAVRVAHTAARFQAGAGVRFGNRLAPRRDGEVHGGAGPMMLGSRYATFQRRAGDPPRLRLQARLGAGVRWVVQTIPGPRGEPEGGVVELRGGKAEVSCPGAELVVIVTALPRGRYDPESRDDRRHAATVSLSAAD